MRQKDLSGYDFITALPCGCVADIRETARTIQTCDELDVICCPWCDSAFCPEELMYWVQFVNVPLLLEEKEPQLIELDGKVFKAKGRCDCGSPVIAKLNSNDVLHLEKVVIDINTLRALYN